MDGIGFDRLTRIIATQRSRRAFGSFLALGALSQTASAKKKKRKGKPKKRPKICVPQCAGKACNASDGCGGTCDTCPSIGKVCALGVCQCFGGKEDCNGTCIAAGARCCQSPGDCNAGEI